MSPKRYAYPAMTITETYNPKSIEEVTQKIWSENNFFEAKEDLSKEKFFCLSMLPYPSGDLHMGHVRNYTIGDVIARYQMSQKRNVLQPMGWDAFGLPAENAAIKRGLSPADWTQKNIKRMRKQFQRMGFAYDWSREIMTCHPKYYQWEQWLFLQLYKNGLAYKKNAVVNWDPVDKTVLANEQVVNGRGWRSNAIVERREISQWFLKITDFAEELLNDLDTLKGWPKQVITMQRNWIGRSKGVTVRFLLDKSSEEIVVFTTRPDTILGVSYLSIAPNHPLARECAKKSSEIANFIKNCQQTRVAEADVATQDKNGIDTGLTAIHPITHKQIPIWITNFVLMEYGTGAVMSVPAHDSRDHEFALKYQLPIQPVIKPLDGTSWDYDQAAYTTTGVLFNSGSFDSLNSKEAFDKITSYLEHHNCGSIKVNYRLRDWGISRQRYWGTPIPIVYCNNCGTIPVPESQLPVELPTDITLAGCGSPLKKCESFYRTQCPQCGQAATRETDTMDTFVESSWYYARYTCPDQNSAMLDDRAKYWTPVDQYVGGVEHAVMHLLYARFMHKVLRNLGILNTNEPFTNLLTQGMVLKEGIKMSKSKGNVVAPQSLIKKYGADTVRLFITFAAPPEQDLEWSESGVEGCFRFLKKLWVFAQWSKTIITPLDKQQAKNYNYQEPTLQAIRQKIHQFLAQANKDIEKLQLNTVVSATMKIFNELTQLSGETDEEAYLIREAMRILLRLLSPITPHICFFLWRDLEFGDNITNVRWPKPDLTALMTEFVEMMIQINGKLRAKINVPNESTQQYIENAALNQEKVQKHIADKKIKKVVIVPKRLINIVV